MLPAASVARVRRALQLFARFLLVQPAEAIRSLPEPIPTLLVAQKAKEVAWSPGKNFMMTALMLWMSGAGVHIFSIMITFYAVYNPIKSAFTVNTAFARFDDAKMGAFFDALQGAPASL